MPYVRSRTDRPAYELQNERCELGRVPQSDQCATAMAQVPSNLKEAAVLRIPPRMFMGDLDEQIQDSSDRRQPEAFIQAKEGLFDPAGDIAADSREFLQDWMDRYVARVKKHAA